VVGTLAVLVKRLMLLKHGTFLISSQYVNKTTLKLINNQDIYQSDGKKEVKDESKKRV
jgi:hypothetical protein